MRHSLLASLVAVAALCCAAPSYAQNILLDAFEGPGTVSSVSPNDGCGIQITVQETVTISGLEALIDVDGSNGQWKFIVANHNDHTNPLVETVPLSYPDTGELEWRRSAPFTITLQAGQTYDLGYVGTTGGAVRYDTTPTVGPKMSSTSQNPRVGTFTNPEITSHHGADCAMRVLGPTRVAVVATAGTQAAPTADQLNDDSFFDFSATVVNVADVDSAAELSAYDVVIIGNSGSYSGGQFTTAFANAVITWSAQGGGGVVSSGWIDFGTREGNPAETALDAVIPIDAVPYGGNQFCTTNTTIVINDDTHPVTVGLTDFVLPASSNVEISPDVDNGAQAVGSGAGNCNSDPAHTIVVDEEGAGRIVYLGPLYMASSSYNATDLRAGPGDRLLEQAVAWAGGVVGGANQTPTVDAGGPYMADEGAAVGLTATGNDPDGDDLTYTWDLDGDGQFDDGTGPSVSYTAGDGPNTVLVSVRADDGNGGSAVAQATIAIANVAPSIDGLTLPNPDESETVTFSAAVSDPAGNDDTLTYLWEFGDGNTSADAAPTHTYQNLGSYSARLTVSDEDGGESSQTFTVVVGDVLPALSTLFGGTNLNEGTTSTYRSTVTKANFDIVDWTFIWGDNTPNEAGVVPVGVTSVEISRTHQFLDDGQFVVRIRATDDEGNQVERQRTVNVANVAPSIDASSIVPNTGPEGTEFQFSVSASDPGADTLTYQWDFGDGISANGSTPTHTYAADGTYTVTLTVSDEDGGSTTEELSVVVTNGPPSIDALDGDQIGDEGGSFSFSASASDPGDDALTYAWTFGDGGTASGADVSHIYADDGDFTVTLTVTDDLGASDSDTLAVVVNNVAPAVTISEPVDPVEGSPAAFGSAVTDPGADTFAYQWDFGDGNTSEAENPSHTYLDDGIYFVQLTVTDDDGGATTRSTQVPVGNVNPQILTLTGDFAGSEGDSFGYQASASDPGSDTLTFSWDFGDGSDVVSDPNLTEVNHVYADNGTYTLTLTVTDEDGGSAERERTVNVGGQAPTIQSLDGDVEGQEGTTFGFVAQAQDPGGDTLTYAWDFGDGTTDEGVDLTEVDHVYAEDGDYTVTLQVSDADGTATATLSVVVNNVAPTFGEISIPGSGNEGQPLSFDATASDPGGDNDPLTFTWDFDDGTDGVVGSSVAHVFANDGAYNVRVTVADDEGASVSVVGLVRVNNVAPTITEFEAPESLNEAASGAFSAAATDPGDDELTFTWTFGDNTPPAIGEDVTHTYADNGQFVVTLTVADGTGQAVRTQAVAVANVAPTIASLTGDTEGGEAETFSYSATASDVAGDADPLTYVWNFGDGTPAVQGVDLTDLDHVYADAGQYTLGLTVRDGDGGQTNRSLVVNVGNRAPTIDELGGDQAGNEGDIFSFSASASDPGGDILTYTWNFGDGTPATSGVGLDTVDHRYADDGEYTLTLTVTDGADSVSSTLDVVVENVSPSLGQLTLPQAFVEGVGFSASATGTDPAGVADPLTFAWDFGDETTAEGATVQHTYADDGTYELRLTIRDGDGGATQVDRTLVVTNGDPRILTFGGPDEVTEGSEATFFAAASDVDADTLTYTWDFEDGPEFDGVDRTEAAHTYPDDGEFNIVLTVTDEDGGETTQQRSLTVTNANPSIDSFVGTFNGQEGDTFDFEATASDPGDDTLTYTWNFGDDNELQSGVDLTQVRHEYTAQGQYTVTLTVTDEDGGSVNIDRTVNVGVAAPTIESFQGPETGVEGGELTFTASATDPVNQELTYVWDFGDGSNPVRGVDLTEVTHTFVDDGSYFVRLTVTDPDDLSATAGQRTEVANLPPTLVSLSLDAFAEATPGTATAEATDPAGDADPLVYTWNFGDGTPEQSGEGLASVEHTYAGNGDYTLTLTIADGDGGSVTETRAVSVGDAAPVIASVEGPESGDEGDTLQYRVEASDPGGDDLTYSWTVGGGDPIDTGDNPTLVVEFPDDGGFIVEVTVTDEEGQTAVDSVLVTIANIAPTIESAVGRESSDEGELVTFFALATDPAGSADPLTYAWDFGDGSDVVEGIDLTQVDHRFADDGDYTVVVAVSDGDGGQASETLEIEVSNVAPTIVSQPPAIAIVNQEYRYNVVAEDPGDDPLTFELVQGPPGMVVDDQDDLVWTLPLDLVDDGPFQVTVRVSDDDGASDEQAYEISTDFIDEDDDGVPDDCERLYGLDPEDPEDGDLDNDQDGINNRTECLQGTNPTEFNGPSAPVLLSPEAEERVATATPELVVENAIDPDGDPLSYDFEVYADADLTQLLTSNLEVPEAVDTTLWTVDVALAEDSWVFWRVRAHDPFVAGPWSETGTFFVDEANEAPSVPTPVAPMGSSDASMPVLLVDAATDPEGDAITYLFEVWEDEGLEGDPVEAGASEAVEYATETDLVEDGVYFWRAAARDALGATSAWSELVPVLINTTNNLPEAPAITSPEDGAELDSATVDIVWTPAVDRDGDALVYELQVATDENFAEVVFEEAEIPEAEGELTRTVGPLAEDMVHYARVRAHDPFGAGAYAQVGFLINAENTKPGAPELISPIGGARVDVGIAPNLDAIEFVFGDAVDPDGDDLVYALRVFGDAAMEDELFAMADIVPDGTGTSAVTWPVASAGVYFWSVEAVDPEGLSAVGGPEEFTVVVGTDEAPSAPVPISPTGGATVTPESFDLVVENAVDPEGAALVYTFQIYADQELGTLLWQATDVAEGTDGTTSVPVVEFDTSGAAAFYWVAFAKDANNRSARSETSMFTVSAVVVTGETNEDCSCATPAAPVGAGWVVVLTAALGTVIGLRRR